MRLMLGDCLDRMQEIESGSVDMILCDLPYGTTDCKWDVVIPFEAMWSEFWRVGKANAAVVLTATQPFTSVLVGSQLRNFRYDWTWDKVHVTGFGNAKKQPLRNKEDVCVFYKKLPTYNPIKTRGKKNHGQGKAVTHFSENYQNGGLGRGPDDNSGWKYPKQIITFPKHSSQGGLHPTQKPVDLMEYLIRTYTNTDETVLDATMGSGTTGVACANTGRRFIGIEKDEAYFQAASNRIEAAYAENADWLALI